MGFLLLVRWILEPIEAPTHDHDVPVAIADGILCLLEPLFPVEPGIEIMVWLKDYPVALNGRCDSDSPLYNLI